MRIKYRFWGAILFIVCNPEFLIAQELDVVTDSVRGEKRNLIQKLVDYLDDTNKEKPDKALDLSFIGGPYYSNETKVGLGLIASGLYRTQRTDPTLPLSNVSLYSTFSTSGFYGIGIRNNSLFRKYRVDLDLGFSSLPSRYWGIGYSAGQADQYTEYTLHEIYLNTSYQRKYKNLYAGLSGMVRNENGVSFDDPGFLNGEPHRVTAVGAGIIGSFDTRDFIPNPEKGIYLKAEYIYFSKGLGGTHTFTRSDLIASYYQSLWEGGILAFDLHGQFNNGAVPWSMLAQMGNSRRMRGYYEGRYRDKKILEGQIELRQKVYGRSGVALWAGAGNVFHHTKDLRADETLPTFGVGYRWEFKKRVNIRLDYGIGRSQSGFYFNINEAF